MANNTGTPSVHVLLLLLCLPVHVDSVFNASMIYSSCIIFCTYVLSVNLGVYYSIGSGTLLFSQQWFIFLLLWSTSTFLYINVCQMLASNKVCRNQVKQSNSKQKSPSAFFDNFAGYKFKQKIPVSIYRFTWFSRIQ